MVKSESYRIHIQQEILNDLQDRLQKTRWPAGYTGTNWDYGVELDYMKEFIHYWINNYNWRSEESKLNNFSWYSVNINGQDVRFIYEKGKGENSVPVILLHGWPDSVMRYIKLIPMLTDPGKFSMDATHSFDVIVPSFIGGFSESSGSPVEFHTREMAETCWQIMVEVLGYERFISAGGDGGSQISQILAVDHPESIIGLHLTDIGWHTNMRNKADLTEDELQYLQGLEYLGFAESAYSMIQGTKPQTLGVALNDSPAGMAAWILEKFRSWSDCNGNLESVYTKDELITNVMLYWLKNSVKSFSYREEFVNMSLQPDQEIHVPVGLALPPGDLGQVIPPRNFAERNLKDIRQWNVLEKGGHFVAMEHPELIATDMLSFLEKVM